MRVRWRAAVGLGLAASAVFLAGCAPIAGQPQPLTQQEIDAIVARDNDYRWEFYFANRPDVVRPVVERRGYVSPGVAADFYAKCRSSDGFDTAYVYRVGLEFGLDPKTQTAAYLAYYTCAAQYPVDPIARGFLSTDQLGFMYDYYAQRLAPCLRSLGFTVPEPPQRGRFIAASFNGDSWNPYDGVTLARSSPVWRLIDERCPPLPAGVYGTRHP